MNPSTSAQVEEDIAEKMLKYENFIHNILRPDLERIGEQYERIASRITEYTTILSAIKPIHENKVDELKAMTDLGNNCYVKCVVPDSEYVYLDIGLNYFVQFRLCEAIQYLESIIEKSKPRTDALLESAAKVKAHIKLVMNLIDQLRSVS